MTKGAESTEEKVAKVVEKAESGQRDILEFSTGVVLRVKQKINPSIILDILAELEANRPQPPVVEMEIMGNIREEENVDDPEYRERMARWETANTTRIADALILTGTEIESVPKGVSKPEDDDWLDLLKVLGFRINYKSKYARYLAWVKHVAIQDEQDWEGLIELVGKRAGVSERDVELAQGSFPGEES